METKKKIGRPSKYATEEERKNAIKISKKKYYANNREKYIEQNMNQYKEKMVDHEYIYASKYADKNIQT